MADFGTIQPITLEEDRKVELESIMARANRALTTAARLLLQVDIAPIMLRRLRDAHLKHQGTEQDPLRKVPHAAVAVAQLREAEEEIIAGWVRTTHQLCVSYEFLNRQAFYDLDLSDYYAEAEWAIWDAMYSYTGDTRFSTLVYWCVKNRLTNFVRQQSRREVMGHLDPNIQIEAASTDHTGDLSQMRKAVEDADLTPIERELIEAHLRGDRGYRARLEQEGRINPDNGRPYNRQWLGHIFKIACDKCRRVYEQRAA